MPGRLAIALVCDVGYLTPTLAAAMSARKYLDIPEADIYIFIIGDHPLWAASLSQEVSRWGVTPVWRRPDGFDEVSAFHRDEHLPPVALGRLWLDDLLPPEVDRFLYLDGDVIVNGSLWPLLHRPPPPGRILVAPDNHQIFLGEHGPAATRDQTYFKALGIRQIDYFNSGVIYAERDTWRTIARDAAAFLMSNPTACRASDQSALNHAAKGKTELISQRYNYQSEHMMVMDPRRRGTEIVIYHFTGGPKPWSSGAWPWDESFNSFYVDASKITSLFDVPLAAAPVSQTEVGAQHRRRFRFRQRWVYPWRYLSRRHRLEALLTGPDEV